MVMIACSGLGIYLRATIMAEAERELQSFHDHKVFSVYQGQ